MELIDLLGRVLFGALFIQNGWAHLTQREAMVGLGRAIGAPRPDLSVPATGAMMLLAGTLIILGVWADLAALALVFFLPFAAYLAHAYWKETDPMMRAAQHAQFWKNIALTGAALFILAVFAQGYETDLTLGSGLF